MTTPFPEEDVDVCQCEHVCHDDGDAHSYAAVPHAGIHIEDVGWVCVDCADRHSRRHPSGFLGRPEGVWLKHRPSQLEGERGAIDAVALIVWTAVLIGGAVMSFGLWLALAWLAGVIADLLP